MPNSLFDSIGYDLTGNKRSSMFGVACYKIGRKPFISFYKEHIVCKLYDEAREEALALDGTSLFEPAEGKRMKNWICIPFDHADKWMYFAELSYAIVECEL